MVGMLCREIFSGQATLNPRFQRPAPNPRHMRQFVTCEVTSGAPKKRARAPRLDSGSTTYLGAPTLTQKALSFFLS